LGLLGAFVILVVVGVATSSSTKTANIAPDVVATQAQPQAQAQAQPTQAPAKLPMTEEQIQVFDSALGYLSDGQGFSKARLYHQLTSSYGEGFSPRLAHWVIRKFDIPRVWNKQAVYSAKGYLKDGQGFSYAELVSQLESPYGEQFTHAQAVHGANVAFRTSNG
jgi:hypothetical protein